MNIIAIDIGNTNINVAFYLDDEEKFIKSVPGDDEAGLVDLLTEAWEQVPVLKSSKEKKRDGVIAACSVKPVWTEKVELLVRERFGEKVYLIGRNIPLPMATALKQPKKIGTDRVVAASAAYDVVGGAVVVADLGTALTIDLVDPLGTFVGGCICPGLAMSATAMAEGTALLPKIDVTKPEYPFGQSTEDAINCGIYYACIGTLEEIIRRYAEFLGSWPQTILTGRAAELIKDDCPFIDTYAPNLVVRGIVTAYKKYIAEESQ